MTRTSVLEALAAEIDAVRRDYPVQIAIDGVDASGKTTMADDLVPLVEAHGKLCLRASMDISINLVTATGQRAATSRLRRTSMKPMTTQVSRRFCWRPSVRAVTCAAAWVCSTCTTIARTPNAGMSRRPIRS
jgi:hypothetical protein